MMGRSMPTGGTMERYWLKAYPPGVPAEVDYRRYRSLVQLMEEAFGRFASRRAYVCMGQAMTFGELDRLSRDFAAWLQARGLKKGDRVAVMLPNVLQYPVAMAGILRAGCVCVNVNPLYTARELAHQLKDSGAEAIVLLENFAHVLQEVLPQTAVRHVVVAAMGDLLGFWRGRLVNFVVRNVKKMVPAFELPNAIRFNRMLEDAERLRLTPPTLDHGDLAFLQYTGGTTGLSKGAALTHRNLVSVVMISEAWLAPALSKGRPAEQVVLMCALPLYHIFALTVCALRGMRTGDLNVLIPNARDIPNLVKEYAKYPVNAFPAVNTLYNALLNDEDFCKLDHGWLKNCNGGGMAVQRAVAQKWLRVTGCPICEGYGLSETSPSATCNPTHTDVFTGTIGLPLPSTEIVILDEEGRPVPIGERGEIAIRGPQVMAGYWNRPEETALVMTADGFFKSGDIGVMDEQGYVRIVDRKKDMILVSGFNVYPNEVEDVIAAHPGVLECAVIGVPDAHSGEAVKAFVVRKDAALTERELMAHCREHLAGYKRPRFLEFRPELPKTNVGKILRRALREQALKKAA
jgi:long-chain acyl-CoA synthetase